MSENPIRLPAESDAPLPGRLEPVVTSRQIIPSAFSSLEAFESTQRMASMLSACDFIPRNYRGREHIANCVVAIDMARRLGIEPLTVMQNLHVIEGRPAWSSQFLISAANTSGKFKTPIRYEWGGEEGADTWSCTAHAIDRTGEVLRGTTVTLAMAKAEGWFGRKGSKWKTIPEQMLRYRAAAFFVRVYAPEIALGMQSAEEVEDLGYAVEAPAHASGPDLARLNSQIASGGALPHVVEQEAAGGAQEVEAHEDSGEQAPARDSGAGAAEEAEKSRGCAHESVAEGEDGRKVCTGCGEILEHPVASSSSMPPRLELGPLLEQIQAVTNDEELATAADLVRELKRGSEERKAAVEELKVAEARIQEEGK